MDEAAHQVVGVCMGDVCMGFTLVQHINALLDLVVIV